MNEKFLNIRKFGTKLKVTKGEHLIRQNDKNENIYFVKKGLLKVYYVTSEGKEFIKTFINEEGFIASVSSMLDLGTCSFNVVALEDSELICVPGNLLMKLSVEDHEMLSSINFALLRLIQKKEKREYEFLCLTAEERYIEFCKEYKCLEQRVSQYDVARYLGITAVGLSRIRNRI